jgi:hypothetical protein
MGSQSTEKDLAVTDTKDLRFRQRVQMDMPVRVRQLPPPRETSEIKMTLDVSRNGLLFRTRETYELNSIIWVTMPYTARAEVKGPEFPATVVRVIKQPGGDIEVGVQFHSSYADKWNHSVYARPGKPVTSSEKRGKSRVRMTLPVRVRSGMMMDESVTLDVSRAGVLFASMQPYVVGQKVFVVIPFQPDGLISGTLMEEPAEVIRFIEREGVRGVAVRFTSRGESRPF